jgi:hypothetical protein
MLARLTSDEVLSWPRGLQNCSLPGCASGIHSYSKHSSPTFQCLRTRNSHQQLENDHSKHAHFQNFPLFSALIQSGPLQVYWSLRLIQEIKTLKFEQDGKTLVMDVRYLDLICHGNVWCHDVMITRSNFSQKGIFRNYLDSNS